MECTVEYLGGTKFGAVARGHRVVCDQPLDNGGADQGMTPPELLMASLGACAGYYAAQYLHARSLPAEGLKVRVVAEKAALPARLASFQIVVDAPFADQERHAQGLLRAVRTCLIHNTLAHAPAIEIEIHNAAVAV